MFASFESCVASLFFVTAVPGADITRERESGVMPLLNLGESWWKWTKHAFSDGDTGLTARPRNGLLTLSGHTPGGQLMLNAKTGFGPLRFRYRPGS
jgi:hypothetical protein